MINFYYLGVTFGIMKNIRLQNLVTWAFKITIVILRNSFVNLITLS